MYARAVDEAAARLRALRYEQWGDLGLAGLALALALAATQARPSLAMPLFLGGAAVGVLGLGALWRRWDLVDRLAGERDAYVISEVFAYALRETSSERRHSLAASIRRGLGGPTLTAEPRLVALEEELEGLAAQLDDDALELDPACAVACTRLLDEFASLPPEILRSHVRQIRAGFRPHGLAA